MPCWRACALGCRSPPPEEWCGVKKHSTVCALRVVMQRCIDKHTSFETAHHTAHPHPAAHTAHPHQPTTHPHQPTTHLHDLYQLHPGLLQQRMAAPPQHPQLAPGQCTPQAGTLSGTGDDGVTLAHQQQHTLGHLRGAGGVCVCACEWRVCVKGGVE